MPYRLSECVAFEVSDQERAVAFYERVFGFQVSRLNENTVELKGGPIRLFLEEGDLDGPIFEFLVPDVEKAKEALLVEGCEIVRWEGTGTCCSLRDSFGFVLNLYEKSDAF